VAVPHVGAVQILRYMCAEEAGQTVEVDTVTGLDEDGAVAEVVEDVGER